MSKHNIEAIYPLSPMQRGMLFHSILDQESAVYTGQFICPIYGALDAEAFKRAWQVIVNRHEILRTLFTWERRDEPLQIVRSQLNLIWEEPDWRHAAPAEQAEYLDAYLAAERKRAFKLSEPPLMRFALIKLADDLHQFVWSKHHLLMDGWSIARIIEEVLTVYEALSNGQEPALRKPRPYKDYIAWLQKQDMSAAESFWRRTLKGFSSALPLPMAESVNPSSTREVSDHELSICLSAHTTAALQSFAREQGLSLNTLMLGAWALLLSRYSDRRDVVFGATVSGRPTELAGVETMVGLFINTLPLRVDVSPEMAVLPWLRSLQAQQVEARQHEHSPLVDIHGWSDVPRGQPLFRTTVVFENYPMKLSLKGQSGNRQSLQVGAPQLREVISYPLSLVVMPGEELKLRLIYDERCYAASAVRRILEHLRTVIEGIAANAEQRLSDVPYLSEAEAHQALIEWNDTDACYATTGYLHEMIEAQAAQTPDAIAVACREDHLSYQTLNRRANQLAHHLSQRGVGPEVRVGISLQRSPDLLVAILATLKAAAAYVPLDPSYPLERLAYMVEDGGLAVVVTEEELAARLPVQTWQLLCIDADWPEIAAEADTPPTVEVYGENIAYVIYTSGSTGRPKGVMISHQGLINYLQWAAMTYPGDAGRGAPLHSSIGFDLSVTSLFLPLLSGCKVALVPEEEGIAGLSHALKRESDYSLVKLTPAHLEMLSEQLSADEVNGCAQALVIGGEALFSEKLAFWRNHAPGTRLINEYGPTETVVGCCVYEVTGECSLPGAVPIGRPISNMRLYVQGDDLRATPTGVAGELAISGIGLARGYLNRPDFTAQVFTPNPFSESPGERLYRTGDVGRYLASGQLEFLGRRDDQVKIRGFRVELSEIEAVLSQHPALQEIAVVVREEAPGDRRLIAYLQSRPEEGLSTDEIRRFLQERLPDYMLPSAYVLLPALPLTPNGKIDRKALPPPDQAQTESQNAYVAPRTQAEKELAQIWSGLFQTEPIGIHDNFFNLGGHSLLLTRLASRIRDTLKVEVPLQVLFDNPTVAQMSTAIAATQAYQIDKAELAEMIKQLKQVPADQVKALLEIEQRD